MSDHTDSPSTAAAPPSASTPTTEIDVLWITAGLSCDGDSVSMTAATLPSIEDVVLGAIPGIPRAEGIR